MMWMICLFGGLGAMARYVLDVSIQQGWNRENRRTNRNFPLSTLVINGVASLCAGIAMMSYYSQSVDMDTVMMFVVGFLGGFSTFSTALNEVVSLIRQRRFTLALGYGIATVAVPLICVAAGFGNAVAAASRAIADGPGSALDESTLVTLALRARDTDAGAITDDGPDLAGYDRFITGNGGKETER